MPFFAANLSLLWTEIPFLDRFDAAAEAGFTGVEVLFPYDTPVQETVAALRKNDLHFVLLNAPPPNYTGGDRGYAAIPGLEKRFEHDLRRAVRYAAALKAETLHIMAGAAEGDGAKQTFLKNLRHAVDVIPESLKLTIEPLNPKAMPTYFLNSFDQAAEIIDAVGSDKLGLQYDTYHAQEITGDALATFKAHQDLIRHIQIGDSPGRTPPGTGTINFEAFFAAVEASGYSGWISAEYTSDIRTEETLQWRAHA